MFLFPVGGDIELRLLTDQHASDLFALVDQSREHLRPSLARRCLLSDASAVDAHHAHRR